MTNSNNNKKEQKAKTKQKCEQRNAHTSNYNNWFEAGGIKNKNILENKNTEDEGGSRS